MCVAIVGTWVKGGEVVFIALRDSVDAEDSEIDVFTRSVLHKSIFQ